MKDEKQRKAEAEAITGEVEGLRGQLEHALAARKRAEEKLKEVTETYTQRLSAQARAIDVTRRETSELNEEIKAAIDARRAADAQKVQLERQQDAYTAKHSTEVAEMIATMKHFSASVTGYNGSLIQSLNTIDTVPFARGAEGGL